MSTASRASTVLVAVDARSRDLAGAEHVVRLLDDLLPATGPTYVASTHVVAGPAGSHLAVVASWSADDADAVSAGAADLLARVRGSAGLEGAGVLVDGAGTVASAGPDDLLDGAAAAAAEHRARAAGRLARYPGRAVVEARVTAGEVVAGSVVDAVEGLAGTVVGPGSELDLTGWARPTWRAGRAVLLVQQGTDGLVPFEVRDQVPCCAHH